MENQVTLKHSAVVQEEFQQPEINSKGGCYAAAAKSLATTLANAVPGVTVTERIWEAASRARHHLACGRKRDRATGPAESGGLASVCDQTSGSAAVGLETAVETTLWDTQVQCVPTNVHGLLGNGLSALLLGRSSTFS